MHACFSVDEISRLLACELVASEGKGTAIALACCCKRLEEPVLDALWGTQERLYPLLETFSGSVWDETVQTFVRILVIPQFASTQPFDWEGFQENAYNSGMGPLQKVRTTDAGTQFKAF